MRLSIRMKLGANERNEIILWLSPKHWITPKRRIQSLRLHSLRRETFRTGCHRLQRNQFCRNLGKYCQEVSTDSRHKTICERASNERSNFGNFSTRSAKRSKSERSVVRATLKLCGVYSSEHGICSQDIMGLAQEHFLSQNNLCSNMWKFWRPPNKTTREKVVASWPVVEHENRNMIVESGASLHVMGENELTSGSHEVPEWLQLFEEGFSGELFPTHTVSWWNNL